MICHRCQNDKFVEHSHTSMIYSHADGIRMDEKCINANSYDAKIFGFIDFEKSIYEFCNWTMQ